MKGNQLPELAFDVPPGAFKVRLRYVCFDSEARSRCVLVAFDVRLRSSDNVEHAEQNLWHFQFTSPLVMLQSFLWRFQFARCMRKYRFMCMCLSLCSCVSL